MPWRETSVMDERLRFVARLLEGEGMSEVCRSFDISRKTGYKIFNRYKDEGLEALTDRSRRPVRYANQLPEPVAAMIVRLKKDKPHWGRARSASCWSRGSPATCGCLPRAGCMRCSTGTAV
jgi:transposase